MAVVLSARLMVRYADKYDPDLASAFEKLGEVLPPALGEHVARTLDVLSRHPRDERFSRHVHLLTKAWAERRIVSLDYEPARYGPDSAPRTARVRPYLIEPSLQTHALYLIGFDETRDAVRTFKVERIRDISLTPETFDPPEAELSRACSIGPGTSSPTRSRSRSCSASRRPSRPASRRPAGIRRSGSRRGATVRSSWRATVAGTIEVRLWALQWGDDVEVLAPASLRDDVAATASAGAPRRYEGAA